MENEVPQDKSAPSEATGRALHFSFLCDRHLKTVSPVRFSIICYFVKDGLPTMHNQARP